MRTTPSARLVRVLAIPVLLLVSGCGGVPDTPEGTFRAYLEAYNEHDCDRLEDLVTSDAEVGVDGVCTGFEHEVDLYMIASVEAETEAPDDAPDGTEARIAVYFESGACDVDLRREDDAWRLHDQACVGTRVDGELVDLGYR